MSIVRKTSLALAMAAAFGVLDGPVTPSARESRAPEKARWLMSQADTKRQRRQARNRALAGRRKR